MLFVNLLTRTPNLTQPTNQKKKRAIQPNPSTPKN